MCPICLVNLGKAADEGLRLRDISDCLVEAVGPASTTLLRERSHHR
jgi:hypothetical protein